MVDYQRIAKAISYIHEYSAEQPGLEEVAKAVHLSPYHFHRLFRKWAGITPKEFLGYISLSNAKKILDEHISVEEAAIQTGLSSTSRLHDLFVKIEGMTPAEYRNNGRNLQIQYSFTGSPFGEILVASTSKGICHLQFVDNRKQGLLKLEELWPDANLNEGITPHITSVKKFFSGNLVDSRSFTLHLRGTDFQIKVWEALINIPPGALTTYARIAAKIGNPAASRAVGTAVGGNPVALLIPCHRVIKKTGSIGEYRWGGIRKKVIIGWEAAKFRKKRLPEQSPFR